MKKLLVTIAIFAMVSAFAPTARAEDTNRNATWGAVTSVTMVAGVATTALMPRIRYDNPESTTGWKARWHVFGLAPTTANLALTLLNEVVLKDAIGTFRPGCDETIQGTGRCTDFASLSSHAFLSFSAVGSGTAVFLVDTIKWNDGRLNVGSLVGNVGVPLVLGVVTSVGRSAGNWESGGTVVVSSLVGLGAGALTGVAYALLQRPECGYGGALICW